MSRTQLSFDAPLEPERRDESDLVDCKSCGCVHRRDVECPWPREGEGGEAT